MDINNAKKQYRTVGLVVFVISIALLLMRIASYYMQVALMDSAMDEAWLYLIFDAAFSVPVQIGLLLVFPFLMYKFALKKSCKEVFVFSGYRKCNIWTCVLSVVLGFLIVFVSLALSLVWQIFLALFGYVPSSSAAPMPEQFNALYFVLTVVLTAVLPAVCEEFAVRGGFMTTLRSRYSKARTILLIAVAFGLFHQNIVQVFYTAMLGALLAYLVLETGSLYPAMIIHFMNNFMSVYLDNAQTYRWAIGGSLFDTITYNLTSNPYVLTASLGLILLAAFGLVVAITVISRKTKKSDCYLELNYSWKELGITKDLRDQIFYIGAIVVTSVSTFITFLFGV